MYLLDVVDGILPEKVLTSMNTASKEEIGAYEEERRLFYVGVTRAKNQLNIFATGKPSRFCNELLEKNISAESYQKLLDELGEGVIVKHRKFGKGVVTEIEGEHIRIRFGDDEKKMDLKVLARLGLLEI